jgi:hypothetical protein
VHLGNCHFRDKRHPAHGDIQPRFGLPGGETDTPEVTHFFRVLRANGFFDTAERPIVSAEVRPVMAGERSDVILANDAAVQWPGQFVSHHQAGTLRIVCVSGTERITMLPDVPTCVESGAPNVTMTMWRGLAAPAGTPEDVVLKLEAAAKAAVASEAFQSAAATIGFQPPLPTTPPSAS